MTRFKSTIIKKSFAFLILVIISTIVKAQNEIPFRTNKGIPIIKLELNGKHANFVLDTGSSLSILDKSVKKHYGFNTRNVNDDTTENTILGIGGKQELNQAYNVSLTIKGKKLICINFKSINLSVVRRSLNVVGIIGSDFLIEHGYIIDFKKKALIKILPLLESDM